MKSPPLIAPERLLDRLDDVLLLVGPDLRVRELLTDAARGLERGPQGRRTLLGEPLSEALATLLAPRALTLVMGQLQAQLEAPAEPIATVRGVEGAASASARAAGLTRYFDLSVQPFFGDDGATLMLGLRDVTERLRLGRALETARNAHELAVAVLRADVTPLQRFLDEASTSLALVQSLLRVPTRGQQAFREKLGRIQEEARSLRLQARALALTPIAAEAARFEVAIESLLAGATVDGDQLLPLALQLDELYAQIGTASQLAEQRGSAKPAEPTVTLRLVTQPPAPTAWTEACAARLSALVDRVSGETGHVARLSLLGLETLPDRYRRNVDYLLVQMVRNAIEHGIEIPAQRIEAGKPATGTIIVECVDRHAAGLEITVRDDGRGFDLDLIGRIAIAKGLLTAESLATTEPRTLIGLIFRQGFSTSADDSGRGLGLEFLRDLVLRMDGNVSVATKPERYTRFRIQLPALADADSATTPQRVA